jgi:hemoglobin-like flavoprotein
MQLDPELLRDSVDLVMTRSPELTLGFYEVLFERHPQLAPMFRRNQRGVQERMLAEAIAAVLDHLDDAAWLEDKLGALGRRHVEYGVTEEMYEQVGDALLVTLARAAGDAWTPAHRDQWALAYGAIASMMKAGAAARAA